MAWLLATSPEESLRNGSKAVELAQQANELVNGNSPVILRVLAAAYAETGDFPKAIEAGQQALALAGKAQNSGLVNALQQELTLYRAKSPVRSNPADMTGWQ